MKKKKPNSKTTNEKPVNIPIPWDSALVALMAVKPEPKPQKKKPVKNQNKRPE